MEPEIESEIFQQKEPAQEALLRPSTVEHASNHEFDSSGRRQMANIRGELSELSGDVSQQNEAQRYVSYTGVKKLVQQQGDVEEMIVTDIDGTAYESTHVAFARKQNKKTSALLEEHHIPLILNSGGNIPQFKAWGLALRGFDASISAHGTVIYHRQENGKFVKDSDWEQQMAESTVSLDGQHFLWGDSVAKDAIAEVVAKAHKAVKKDINGLSRLERKHRNREYSVEFMIQNIPTASLQLYIEAVQKAVGNNNGKVIVAESRARKNSLDTFSGIIAVIPPSGGKLSATCFLTEKYRSLAGNKKIKVHAFGDSLGDRGLVSQQHVSDSILWYPHVVHPTPLLERCIQTANPLHIEKSADIEKLQDASLGKPIIHHTSAPEAIGDVAEAIIGFVPNPRNSWLRNVLQKSYWLMDWMYPKNADADKVIELSMHYITNAVTSNRGKFLRGYIGDLIDGYRARKDPAILASLERQKRGQLLDGFRDRLVEATQLGIRAQERIITNPANGLHTLEAMVSCVLPSLARAETEVLTGRSVKEGKNGSMLTRTIHLGVAYYAKRFLPKIIANRISYNQDQTILNQNTLAYRTRQHMANFVTDRQNHQTPRLADFPDTGTPLEQFRRKAFERFFLYRSILQDTDLLARNLLATITDAVVRETLEQQYATWIRKTGITMYLQPYPDENVVELLKDPKLQLHNYISIKDGKLQFSIPN